MCMKVEKELTTPLTPGTSFLFFFVARTAIVLLQMTFVTQRLKAADVVKMFRSLNNRLISAVKSCQFYLQSQKNHTFAMKALESVQYGEIQLLCYF